MKVRVFLVLVLLSFGCCVDFETFVDHDDEKFSDSATHGVSSRHDEFPYMTALGWWNENTKEVEFLCGGMLITPTFVLTAAHCLFFKGRLPNLLKIGGNRLNSTHNENNIIRNFFIHPLYVNTQAYHDVALLELEIYSKKPTICLWSRPTIPSSRVIAIGYGATKFAGSTTPILQKVNLVLVRIGLCRSYHEGKRKFRFGVSNEHLCAGDPNGRQDICQGDSGGPLILSENHEQYAVGIISSGQACFGFPPAIFTKISSYVRWIADVLNSVSNTNPKICY